MTNIHASAQSDSTCAIAYVNNMGGMASLSMDLLTSQLWQWCCHREIFISASLIPGICNVEADFSFQNFSDSTEWMLKKVLFNRLCEQTFYPDVDLFASYNNHQTEKFVSWFLQPGAWRYDAFSFSWKGLCPCIFAPFNLISRILNKIVEDKVEQTLLVVPHWTTQSWFPLLSSLLISSPIRIPRHVDQLFLPYNNLPHPLGKTLSLIGVIVSGYPSRSEEFHQMLPLQLQTPGEKGLKNNTHWHGRSGLFETFQNRLIRFVPLK